MADPFVPAHVVDDVVMRQSQTVFQSADHYAKLFRPESPIEAALGFVLWHEFSELTLCPKHSGLILWERYEIDTMALASPQVQVGPYRVDFMVTCKRGGRFAVECDGHDFHERTKTQAARDKKRDRYFAAQGIHVLRFTGSEIWQSVFSCAEEVVAQIYACAEQSDIGSPEFSTPLHDGHA